MKSSPDVTQILGVAAAGAQLCSQKDKQRRNTSKRSRKKDKISEERHAWRLFGINLYVCTKEKRRKAHRNHLQATKASQPGHWPPLNVPFPTIFFFSACNVTWCTLLARAQRSWVAIIPGTPRWQAAAVHVGLLGPAHREEHAMSKG